MYRYRFVFSRVTSFTGCENLFNYTLKKIVTKCNYHSDDAAGTAVSNVVTRTPCDYFFLISTLKKHKNIKTIEVCICDQLNFLPTSNTYTLKSYLLYYGNMYKIYNKLNRK